MWRRPDTLHIRTVLATVVVNVSICEQKDLYTGLSRDWGQNPLNESPVSYPETIRLPYRCRCKYMPSYAICNSLGTMLGVECIFSCKETFCHTRHYLFVTVAYDALLLYITLKSDVRRPPLSTMQLPKVNNLLIHYIQRTLSCSINSFRHLMDIMTKLLKYYSYFKDLQQTALRQTFTEKSDVL
jgi:hypothetical protein